MLTALLEPAPRVVLVGGEERGTWLVEHKMASERAFAFAAELRADAAGAIGRVARVELAHDAIEQACPSLAELADALAERKPLAWRGGGGAWSLDWR